MRILMLGGTNLTGPYVVRRLQALDHEVSVFHRGEHEADLSWGVRHIRGDFRRLPREAFDPSPEVIVHMWAITEKDAELFVSGFRGVASLQL
jgi:nucleoside-diphosphate-sugar epimerase